MQIGRSDVVWNYAATFLKISAGLLLLPLILAKLPTETTGIWTIFMTVTSFVGLFDFGFSPSFARNVTYVFSGINKLMPIGYNSIVNGEVLVDYSLLKGLINSMRWFYSLISFVLFVILISFGGYYIYTLLKHYSGNHTEVFISWFILCAINTYSLFTQYYDSLIQGKGLVRLSKQITIVGQLAYLLVAGALILIGQNLIAIVLAQATSVIIIRLLSHHSFFSKDMKNHLHAVISVQKKEIFKAIYPNAIKVGLTSVGGFAVNKAAIIVGSLYLPLSAIASYGVSIQLITVIASLASIYTSTFSPKISQYRVQNNTIAIKNIYLRGQIVLVLTFIIGGLVLLVSGEWVLNAIGSRTVLMSRPLIFIALVINLLETNHAVAAGIILMSKNEVPFFKAALLSGAASLVLLIVSLSVLKLGIICLLLSPGIVQLSYQNWKWPLDVKSELNIILSDYGLTLKTSVINFSKAVFKE